MILADASVLAKVVLAEEGWRGVLEELLSEESYTVDLAAKEVLNALWKACRLRGILDCSEASRRAELLLSELLGGVVTVLPESRFTRRAFHVAIEANVTVYDALYIAAAAELGARLLTCDSKQAEAASRIGVEVKLIS